MLVCRSMWSDSSSTAHWYQSIGSWNAVARLERKSAAANVPPLRSVPWTTRELSEPELTTTDLRIAMNPVGTTNTVSTTKPPDVCPLQSVVDLVVVMVRLSPQQTSVGASRCSRAPTGTPSEDLNRRTAAMAAARKRWPERSRWQSEPPHV